MKKIVFLVSMVLLASCASKNKQIADQPIRGVKYSGEALASGKQIMENDCAKCHKAYSPKDFKQEDWKPIINRMAKKANLTDEQKYQVLDYITYTLSE